MYITSSAPPERSARAAGLVSFRKRKTEKCIEEQKSRANFRFLAGRDEETEGVSGGGGDDGSHGSFVACSIAGMR